VRRPGITRRHSWRWCPAFLLVGLAACSLLPGTDPPIPECECPILIAEVESIDWVPGVGGRQISGQREPDGSRPLVTYEFEVDDAATEVNRLGDALASAGFDIEEDSGAVHARDARLRVTVHQPEGRLRITVTLLGEATDEQAPEILAPVKEAVGHR